MDDQALALSRIFRRRAKCAWILGLAIWRSQDASSNLGQPNQIFDLRFEVGSPRKFGPVPT